MTFRPHYADGIDTQKFGHDEDPDHIGGFGSYHLSKLGKGLLAVFQSLPETKREVDYNLQFIDHQSHFTDEKPEGSYRVTNHCISIDAFPKGIPKYELHQRACERINPEQYAKNMAVFEGLKEQYTTTETSLTEATHAWRVAEIQEEPKEHVEALSAQMEALRADVSTLHWKLSNFTRRPAFRPEHARPTMFEGFDYQEVAAQEAAMRAEFYADAVKPYAALLDHAGIEYRICHHDSGMATVELDQEQPQLAEKISALMDTHREAIAERYEGAKFVLTKPTGEALDKNQAARAIAARYAMLNEDAAALDTAAEKYGVGNMVQALTSPRTGRSRAVGDGVSGD